MAMAKAALPYCHTRPLPVRIPFRTERWVHVLSPSMVWAPPTRGERTPTSRAGVSWTESVIKPVGIMGGKMTTKDRVQKHRATLRAKQCGRPSCKKPKQRFWLDINPEPEGFRLSTTSHDFTGHSTTARQKPTSGKIPRLNILWIWRKPGYSAIRTLLVKVPWLFWLDTYRCLARTAFKPNGRYIAHINDGRSGIIIPVLPVSASVLYRSDICSALSFIHSVTVTESRILLPNLPTCSVSDDVVLDPYLNSDWDRTLSDHTHPRYMASPSQTDPPSVFF